jgi:hypothetical protein
MIQQRKATNQTPSLSSALNQLRHRLQEWRRQRSGCPRIPEPFWTEALALAQTEGVSRVSRILRLSYGRLKAGLKKSAPILKPGTTPTFLELPFPSYFPGPGECRVELTHRTGAKMTIHWQAAPSSQLLPLVQAFWS